VSDDVLQTLQKLVQDVIAPDVRETKVRLESLSKETDTRFEAIQKQIDFRFDSVERQLHSLSKESDAQFKALLSAIAELKAQTELATMNAVADVRERVAVLESKHA